jgi:hypothetical protein
MQEELLEIPDEATMFLLPFLDYIVGTNPRTRTIYMNIPAGLYNWDRMDYSVMIEMGISQVKARKAGLCNVPDRNGNNVGLGFTHYELELSFHKKKTTEVPVAKRLPINKSLIVTKSGKLVKRLLNLVHRVASGNQV